MRLPEAAQATTEGPGLVRAIGRFSLLALAINSIIGSGIFGLPSALAAAVGRASPWVVLGGGAGAGIILACYAEVASQFPETGGTYLYVRETFGRFAGMQTGWMSLLSRLAACAAAANLFVMYLGEFWPAAAHAIPRTLILSALLASLTLVNYRGVSSAARLSNVVVIAKLLPLAVLCGIGVVALIRHSAAPPDAAPVVRDWLGALLLLIFAYGGYEAALNPMGEVRDPRRDVAFALFGAFAVVTVLYTILQFTTMVVLAHPAQSARPLADIARVLLGRQGAILTALAALVSVYGYLSANLLTTPRAMFALAAHGDFPPLFAAVHSRFRTPYVSILVFAVLLGTFALLGSFTWNVTLSAVARLAYYAAVCAAVPVLRRRRPAAAAFRLPGGVLLPALGVGLCTVLLAGVDFRQSLVLLVTIGIAGVNWLLVRGRRSTHARG
jgi:basic amino acid/polyamine antiporter, APA family